MLELICSASMGADMGIGCRGSDCVMGPRDCVYPLEMSYCGSARRSHRDVSRFSIHADSRAASMRRENQQSFPLFRGSRRVTPLSLAIPAAGRGGPQFPGFADGDLWAGGELAEDAVFG